MKPDPIRNGPLDHRLLLLDARDNVLVARAPLATGEKLVIESQTVVLTHQIGLGHKLARRAIGAGDKVVKYGAPIGSATRTIAPGEHVHLLNIKSDYTPTFALEMEEVS